MMHNWSANSGDTRFRIPLLSQISIDRALVAYGYLPHHPGMDRIYEHLLPYVRPTWDRLRIRTRFGVRFECDLRDLVAREIYYTGFARRDCRVLKRLIKPGNVVLDVGANIGYFSLLFAKWMHGAGTVHAFEPFPHSAKRFGSNLDLNPQLRTMVHLHRLALSDFSGTMAMSVPDEGNCGCNYLSTSGPVEVEVTTLDAYVRQTQLARIDFIKIDVEGAEVSLLQGAEETIGRYHPTLIIEINASTLRRFGKTPADLIGILEKHSYRLSCANRIGGLNPLKRVPVFGEEPNVFAFPTYYAASTGPCA
jgi:FkbM family methyltransferase